MPLRQSPLRTPALLAANRANALKSTGPRTPQGRARVGLNSLKHGGYAVNLRERLLRMGEHESEAQYRWFRSEIARAFGVSCPQERQQAERLAAKAWCLARQAAKWGAKPEYGVFSTPKAAQHPSLFPFRIDDRVRRVGLAFWQQLRPYWTLERKLRVLLGREPLEPPPGGFRPEQRWRRRIFRLRKPSLWERMEIEAEIQRRSGRKSE